MNVRSNLSKRIKKVFTKSVFRKFSLLAVVLVFSACSFQEEDETINDFDRYRDERHANIMKNLSFSETFDVAFMGDSITYLGDFENVFSDKNCVNLGVASITIRNLRSYLDMIVEANPKKLFLMIGVNSFLFREGNFYEVLADYETLIQEIKSLCPDTQIFIESVLPVAANMADFVPNTVIQEFNKYLVKFAQKYDATFIDLYSLYEVDGYLDESFTEDGLHLKEFAYQAWYDEVAKYMD